MELLNEPAPFADALRSRGAMLLHGDLRLDNLGVDGDCCVMLDWQAATWGPPEFELCWLLPHNARRTQLTNDEVVELFASVTAGVLGSRARGSAREEALELSLLGGLLLMGMDMAWRVAEADGPDEQARAEEDLRWWGERGAGALGLL